MDAVEKLAKRFQRTLKRSEPVRLNEAHASSILLPQDYCDFLATFGPCAFTDDRFLFFIADLSSADHSTALDIFAVLYDRDYQFRQKTISGFRQTTGLIPWGCDDQETTFYWIADDGDPNDWRVVVDVGELVTVPQNMSELLLRCFTDKIPFYNNEPWFTDDLRYQPG